jgi:hypothetical protein
MQMTFEAIKKISAGLASPHTDSSSGTTGIPTKEVAKEEWGYFGGMEV